MNSNISYTYTLDGTRLAKQVGNTKTEYTLDGNLIVRQQTGGVAGEILNFYYDSAGKLLEIGYKYNALAAEHFFFVTRNSQGDIVEIYKSADSTLVGSYSYDSWGKLLGATYAAGVNVSSVYDILNKNPFRYRGYYYDQETGWYYLQSRYYDPEVKRFVNADDIGVINVEQGDIGQYNIYAYCFSDPINNHDPSGYLVKEIINWITDNLTGTLSTGVNITVSLGFWSFSGQIDNVVDAKGNYTQQWSLSGGLTTGTPGISVTTPTTITNAESTDALLGSGIQMGASGATMLGPIPLAGSAEFVGMMDEKNNIKYVGGNLAPGFGTPGGEIHIHMGYTGTLREPINFFSLFQN